MKKYIAAAAVILVLGAAGFTSAQAEMAAKNSLSIAPGPVAPPGVLVPAGEGLATGRVGNTRDTFGVGTGSVPQAGISGAATPTVKAQRIVWNRQVVYIRNMIAASRNQNEIRAYRGFLDALNLSPGLQLSPQAFIDSGLPQEDQKWLLKNSAQ